MYAFSIQEKLKDENAKAEQQDWKSALEVRDKDGYPDFAKLRELRPDAGCTANMCLFVGDHVICANVGDSRTNILEDNVALPLSVDHKPTVKSEAERI